MLMAPISCSFESFAQSRHVITYDRVRKSCRYSDHLVSGEIRRHLVNNHNGSAVASAACFTKNSKCVQSIHHFVAEDSVTDFLCVNFARKSDAWAEWAQSKQE